MIHLDSVTKTYKSSERNLNALDTLTLDVEAKEFVAVIGPSGAGKSTLLFTVGGLIRPTSGEVVIAGENIYGLGTFARARFRRKHLGFVFQTFHLLPYLTAEENVLVALHLAGITGKEARQKASAALGKFGLAKWVRHRPGELSVGQQQRVALARAVVHEPDIILADEPTGNLDFDLGAQVINYLKEFAASGKTVLLVTHDPRAAEFAARILRIEEGKISGKNVEKEKNQ